MRKFFFTAIVAISLLVSGCSIHPLPEDYTRVSSYDIAQRIRCETRIAIAKQFYRILEEEKESRAYKIAKKIYDKGLNDVEFTNKLSANVKHIHFDKNTRMLVGAFYQVGIGYDFQFDIEEKNDNSSTLKFSMPFSNGKMLLDLGTTHNKARKNIREFALIDKVHPLFNNNEVCKDKHYAENKKWTYPITGQIGMEEVIRTFYMLITSDSDVNTKEKATVFDFSDTLTFTTTLKGNANPKVELNPVSNQLRLIEAGLNSSVSRVDKHRVGIVFYPYKDFNQEGIREALEKFQARIDERQNN